MSDLSALDKQPLIHCPFCGDADFDHIGLKDHLLRGFCNEFEGVEALEHLPPVPPTFPEPD